MPSSLVLSHPGPDPGADLVDLHPALWRTHQLGRAVGAVQSSGFAALDALLPGGGWPHAALTELLLPHAGVGEMRLLAPALRALPQTMLFAPPALPCAAALQQLGLDPARWVLVQGPSSDSGAVRTPLAVGHPRPQSPAAGLLWALEQSLRAGHEAAVLAWLPGRLPPQALHRLQLAAQAHGGPVFVLRSVAAAARHSPAPLRLSLQPGAVPDELQLRVLKRRGPPAPQPLRLHLRGPAVLLAAPGAQTDGLAPGEVASPTPEPALAPAAVSA